MFDNYNRAYEYRVSNIYYVEIDDPERSKVFEYSRGEVPVATLITCGGVWSPEKGTYDKRLIVNAELISDVPGENDFVGEQKSLSFNWLQPRLPIWNKRFWYFVNESWSWEVARGSGYLPSLGKTWWNLFFSLLFLCNIKDFRILLRKKISEICIIFSSFSKYKFKYAGFCRLN